MRKFIDLNGNVKIDNITKYVTQTTKTYYTNKNVEYTIINTDGKINKYITTNGVKREVDPTLFSPRPDPLASRSASHAHRSGGDRAGRDTRSAVLRPTCDRSVTSLRTSRDGQWIR